jgi:N-acetylneuraminate lyase
MYNDPEQASFSSSNGLKLEQGLQEMHERIEGLVAASFTAMHKDGSVNLAMIERQAEHLARNGVVGVFVCGSTGESLSLTVKERMDIARRWVEAAPGELKVIVHCGHNSLEACRELAAHAQRAGAFGIAAMPPCFFRPHALGDLVDFFAETAASAPSLPCYYYHIPSMTGVHFPMTDFLEAAAPKIPNLAGIKYTFEDLMDFNLCRQAEGGRFDLLFGRDEHLICGLALGARGAVGSTYNFAAPLYNELIQAFDAGDLDRARRLQVKSQRMIRLFQGVDASFLCAMKTVMKMVGVDCGPGRLPLRNLTPKQEEEVRAGLEDIGIFE